MEKKILTFKKIAKIQLPSPHFYGSLEGEGAGVFIGGRSKAPIVIYDSVLNVEHQHRVMAPTGAFGPMDFRHQVVT